MFLNNNELYELEILRHIEITPQLNNRLAAKEIKGSVRLAHDLLTRIGKKGWVRIEKVNSRRWDYYLTASGVERKNELAAAQWRFAVQIYRDIRQAGQRLAQLFEARQIRQVALFGISEITEIAYLCLMERQLSVSAVFSDRMPSFLGIPVRSTAAMTENVAGVVIYCGDGEVDLFSLKNLPDGISFPEKTYNVLGEKVQAGASVPAWTEADRRIDKMIADIETVLLHNLACPFELYWLNPEEGMRQRIELRLRAPQKANMEKIREEIADINIMYLFDLMELRQMDETEYEQIRHSSRKIR